MKFTVKAVKDGCRIGQLLFPTKDITVNTPACMLYTRGASAPHLSKDVLKRLENVPKIIHVPLCYVADIQDALESYKDGLQKFSANEGFVLFTSVCDPAVEVPSGFNEKNNITVWGRGGRLKIDVDKFVKLQETAQPEFYEVMCDPDTIKDATKKRLKKSRENTLRFLDSCVERHKDSEMLRDRGILAFLGGGHVEEERTLWSKEVEQCSVSGYIVGGFHNFGNSSANFPLTDITPLIISSLKGVSEQKPRFMQHYWSPDNVILGLEAGIDVVDSSYPYIVTERNGALIFPYLTNCSRAKNSEESLDISDDKTEDEVCDPNHPFEINLKDERYVGDKRALVPGCTCYTCTTHTRSYLKHLINTEELLASILLSIHNFHHYFEFFSAIRQALEDDTFSQLKELIVKTAAKSQ